jgi:hypothetical protein
MAILLCSLGGLMFLIGTFASIVSYCGALDDANVGGSGKYTCMGASSSRDSLCFSVA